MTSAHRPSRFDRVRRSDNPLRELRRRYLSTRISGFPSDARDKIVNSTVDWSFAYLNELRTTAAIVALRNGRSDPESWDLLEAHSLRAAQFHSGRRNHSQPRWRRSVGFGRIA